MSFLRGNEMLDKWSNGCYTFGSSLRHWIVKMGLQGNLPCYPYNNSNKFYERYDQAIQFQFYCSKTDPGFQS